MQRLVATLKANGIVKDAKVEATLNQVDRANYCPSQYPYTDTPCSIGYGATISAPHMHAYALELLKDKLVDGAKVLDIGAGSGYLTSCLAHMVGPQGRVYGVEHIKQLAKKAEDNIRRDCSELLDSGRIKLLVADGRVGLPDFAPYDVIHVGATASEHIPDKLVDQLKEGGRMVLPVHRGQKQMFESVEKLPGGAIEKKQLFGVHYVPLTDIHSQLEQNY